MFENNIPTGSANFFSDSKLAKSHLETIEFPIVLKADGLAAGKGVLVAKELGEAMQWIEDVMEKNKFGNAGNEVLIEECLFGTELSYMGIMTPYGFFPFETSVDYKLLLDGNCGPNTGGMGCISPSPFMNSELLKNINNQVVEPTVNGLRKAKIDFYGFMYFGLMVKDDQPKVLEYNCRLGDPETQCLMLQLESDMLKVLLDALSGNLENITWSKKSSMGVVMASGGYPESYKKDQHIEILELSEVKLFHAGTRKENGELFTSGGRVFSLNTKAPDLEACKKIIYTNIKNIKFNDMVYRNDIGDIYES
jgi:phosphoribosylamine--glycine ligase